jgi:hypothetical protein
VTEGGTNSTVSGRVVTVSGQGLAGVTINFSAAISYAGLPGPVVTDANGYWSQSGFVDCKGHFATASKNGYTFSPLKNFFSPGATNLDFTGSQQSARHQLGGDEAVAQASKGDRRPRVIADEKVLLTSSGIMPSAGSAGVGVLSCLVLFAAIRLYGIRSQRKSPPDL